MLCTMNKLCSYISILFCFLLTLFESFVIIVSYLLCCDVKSLNFYISGL